MGKITSVRKNRFNEIGKSKMSITKKEEIILDKLIKLREKTGLRIYRSRKKIAFDELKVIDIADKIKILEEKKYGKIK